MCGRFTFWLTPQQMQECFDLFRVPDYSPRYNIAPTQQVVTIRADEQGKRSGSLQAWGLVPPWSENPNVGSQMINCRSESAATKPAFRRAFRERRCLIPACGFYEWQAAGKETQPWFLSLKSGSPFAFAGLWETWADPAGRLLETCTILTTSANEFMAEVHERMPVVVERAAWPLWLDPQLRDPESIQSLLTSSLSEVWQRVPVSRLVNQVRNDHRDCLRPVRLQRGLFDDVHGPAENSEV